MAQRLEHAVRDRTDRLIEKAFTMDTTTRDMYDLAVLIQLRRVDKDILRELGRMANLTGPAFRRLAAALVDMVEEVADPDRSPPPPGGYVWVVRNAHGHIHDTLHVPGDWVLEETPGEEFVVLRDRRTRSACRLPRVDLIALNGERHADDSGTREHSGPVAADPPGPDDGAATGPSVGA